MGGLSFLSCLMPKRDEIVRPSKQDPAGGLLWYPEAVALQPEMKTQGRYERGYPRGAVVHYTAGSTAASAISQAMTSGYAYFVIDRGGVIYQGAPLDRWGYHCGPSQHPDFPGATGLSRHLVGIEMVSAGRVEEDKPDADGVRRFRQWWEKNPSRFLREDEVRYAATDFNNVRAGYYHAFDDDQESALVNLLMWLKTNDVTDSFGLPWVLGHDEIAPGRKSDPGAALSMSMPDFRLKLYRLLQESGL